MEIKGFPEPDEKHEGNAHHYRWPEFGLDVTVDRLHKNARGVQGEININTTEGGFLHWGSISLASKSNRAELIRLLPKTTDQVIDWRAVLEWVCKKTVMQQRAGEPLVNLMDRVISPPLRWCIYPLLEHGTVNILYGDGGSLKSYLALALCIAAYGRDARLTGLEVKCEHKPLYLDWEDDADIHGDRMRRLLQPYPDCDVLEMPYKRCRSSLAEMGEEIRALVLREKVELLVMDSLTYACGGNPNEDETVGMVAEVVRQVGGTLLMIAHDTKEKGKGIRGSKMWRNWGRNIFEVKSFAEPGKNIVQMAIKDVKGNHRAKIKPFGLQVDFENDQTVITKQDLRKVPEASEYWSTLDKIIEAMQDGDKSLKELDDMIPDTKADTINRTVRRHRETKFVNRGRGIWGLRT